MSTEVIDQPPGFTDAELAAIRDFWEVYDAHYEEVSDSLLADLSTRPAIAPIIAAIPPEEAEARREASREKIRRAVLDGEWKAYLEDLHEQGAGYAQLGVGFQVWFDIVGAFRGHIRPIIVATYAKDAQRAENAINGMNRFLDVAMATIGESYLRTKEETINQQQDAIRELSTPVLQVRDGLIILPIVGLLDSERARLLTEALLEGIRQYRARVVVLDVTGVAAVDSAVANHLLQTVRAAWLMGAKAIVTGVSVSNAQTLVRIGVDLSGLRTMGDLRAGLEEADRLLAGSS